MALIGVITELVVVVATMLATTVLVLVGPRQFTTAIRDARVRFEAIAAPVGVLLVVLLLRWATRDVAARLSWRVVGRNISPLIFRAEAFVFGRNPVAVLQSYQSDELTSLFVFVYLYGYVFLLTFPFLAYFALEEMDELSTLIVAYAANYGIGLLCYVVFIAFGPRNYDPLLFENLLYDAFPQSRYLTNEINQYTNVFPSLHASLSMTTLFLAWQTREKYPLWLPIAAFFALSVVLSTMYLGIHWFSDVVAGTVLAILSVYIGRNYSVSDGVRSVRNSLRRYVDRGAGSGVKRE